MLHITHNFELTLYPNGGAYIVYPKVSQTDAISSPVTAIDKDFRIVTKKMDFSKWILGPSERYVVEKASFLEG